MDMNMNMGCMLMAGMHEMQVSVYQAGALDDSCPDIPYPGTAVVTLTSASKELRDMTAEVRIVRGAEADAAGGRPSRSGHACLSAAEELIRQGSSRSQPTSISQVTYAVLVTVSDGKDMTMSGRLVVTVAQEDAEMDPCFRPCRNCCGGWVRLLFVGS